MKRPQGVSFELHIPKGPGHAKNSMHIDFTMCREFATRSDSLLKM